MPISLTCSCGANLRAPDDAAGKTIACPKCKGHLKVPFHAKTEESPESNFKSMGITQFQMPADQEYDRDSDEALGTASKLSRINRAPAKPNMVAWLLGGVSALVLICCAGSVAFFTLGIKEQHQQEEKEIISGSAIKVTADELCREYAKGNEFAADSKYKDKVLEVTGTMKRAEHVLGNAFVILDGGVDPLSPDVHCYFDDRYRDELAKLEVGEKVIVKGRCSGKSLNVGLKDCIIAASTKSPLKIAKTSRQPDKSTQDSAKRQSWEDIGNAVKVGDVRVVCLSVQKNTFSCKHIGEWRIHTTMVVELKLSNQSTTKIVEFKGWQKADSIVEDEHGNRYGTIDFGLGFDGFGDGLWNRWNTDSTVDASSILVFNNLSLHPSKTYITYLFCMEPADVSKEARLTLPAKTLGGTGTIRLRVPILSSVGASAAKPAEKPSPAKSVKDYCNELKDKDPKNRIEAARQLGELKDDTSVLPLVESLKDENTQVRVTAAESLGMMGPSAKPGYSSLFDALHDPSDEVAKAAFGALDKIPPSQEELPILTAGLTDPKAMVRLFAIKALANATGFQVPVSAFASALKDRDKEVRRIAANGLAKAGLGAKPFLSDIVQALDDDDAKVRLALTLILGAFGPDAKAAVPKLTSLLNEKNKDLRKNAALVLGKIGPEAKPALAALITLADDPDKEVRLNAVVALVEIGPDQATLPVLIKVLRDSAPTLQAAAAEGLGKFGPDAKEAVPILTKLLEADELAVRQKAASALGMIGPKAWGAVPALAKALSDSAPTVRKEAVIALRKIGPDAQASVPNLVAALKDKKIHDDAVLALVKIGKNGVPQLANALEETRDVPVRLDLIGIFAQIGPDASEAIPALTTIATTNQLPGTRKAAQNALEKIQGKR